MFSFVEPPAPTIMHSVGLGVLTFLMGGMRLPNAVSYKGGFGKSNAKTSPTCPLAPSSRTPLAFFTRSPLLALP